MKRNTLIVVAALATLALPAVAGEVPTTPKSIVKAYDALADTILATRSAELNFVKALLDGHLHAAKTSMKNGNYEAAAGFMALFANEGDNNIGGVRKKLLEGGHHFNADGEEAGIFEDGYVVVTREAKAGMLEASKELRLAEDEEGRMAAWKKFAEVAKPLLMGKKAMAEGEMSEGEMKPMDKKTEDG